MMLYRFSCDQTKEAHAVIVIICISGTSKVNLGIHDGSFCLAWSIKTPLPISEGGFSPGSAAALRERRGLSRMLVKIFESKVGLDTSEM